MPADAEPPYLLFPHERCGTCARLRSQLSDEPEFRAGTFARSARVETDDGEVLAEGHDAVLDFATAHADGEFDRSEVE